MERKDLLGANAKIFEGQGKALNQYADRNVKGKFYGFLILFYFIFYLFKNKHLYYYLIFLIVCVVGNPANTNALIAALNAPNIPKENFTALTRLYFFNLYSI